MTLSDLKRSKVAHLNQKVFEEAEKPAKKPVKKNGRSKYGNKKTVVNGITFDSEREAKRYSKLLFLLKKGFIGMLRLQVEYELNTGGTHSLKYIADFVYIVVETGETIVEDCKGHRTQEYIKKRRLMKKVHGITIKET